MAHELELKTEEIALLVIDVQEKLAPVMEPGLYGRLVENLARLGGAQGQLGFPVLLSEQYPQGLGPTVASVRGAFEGVPALPKFTFSAPRDAGLKQAIESTGRPTIIVAGMEAHICVYQTVRDLLATHRVHVLSDAIASRTKENHQIGVELMRRAGAVITSTETVLFDLLERAGTDAFKVVSKLVK